MENENNKKPRLLTMDEAIKLHKKEHKDIYSIDVEGHWLLLKKPNRQTYSECISLVAPIGKQKPDLITAGLRIMQACFIDGDKDLFFKDDEFLVPAAMKAIELLNSKEASLKKN